MEVENHLNWTEGLINAIDYIETHLIDGEVLDQNTIARQAYSSPDNFRKVFHLITGYTIGEYIRNRRLSLAGEELISSNRTVTDIALEYGYDTLESFTKAFTRFHGNSPTYVRNNKSGLHNFTRIVLRVTADGGSMLNYRIVKINNMCIAGYSRVFTSLDTAKNNILISKFTRECCSQSWDKLMEIKSTDEKPNNCLFGYRSNDFINIDKFNNEISCFNYTFGRMITKQEISGLNISDYSITSIPDGEWICFDCSDTTPAGQQSLWYKIYTEFLPFSHYNIAPDITLECSNVSLKKEQNYLLLQIRPDKV